MKFKPNMNVSRAEMEKIIWSATHSDFKSSAGGVKSIFYGSAGAGTTLAPLSSIPINALKEIYKDSAAIRYMHKDKPYSILRGGQARSSVPVFVKTVKGRDAADKAIKQLNASARAKRDFDTIFTHVADEDGSARKLYGKATANG